VYEYTERGAAGSRRGRGWCMTTTNGRNGVLRAGVRVRVRPDNGQLGKRPIDSGEIHEVQGSLVVIVSDSTGSLVAYRGMQCWRVPAH